MLVVNPIDRITIPAIMDSKWFNINLPDYLKPLERIADHTRDENIALKLSKTFSCSIDDVHDHLNRKEQNDIKEAYLLLAENQNMRKDSRLIGAQNMQNFFASSPPSWNHGGSHRSPRSHHASQAHHGTPSPLVFGFRGDLSEKPPRSTISILSSSLPSYHESFMRREMPDFHLESLPARKNKTRWHFGIRSRSPPLEVMAEIYRALEKMGAQWSFHNPDPFSIKCLWKKQDEGMLIHMDIQLYLLEPGSHLVDFKSAGYYTISTGEEISKPAMSPFPFLDIATRLITSLV
ncbi:Carbon catabolite-derepressing protein kinase [Neolecta irregularis DAH-3]|uniref:non-specific serine/threonine protein kinase n=1 Tax=Neolecta irregularis (strain DAH-3) TaxID=1198029 RepID=A0A1U7LLV2_NEOID|nr:Carbon catabolite-derepressing protein kinase [Neolecta irregularis DAH-3]|eukprot:OLL23627.1 Carbon catabolite-derepressing protein kinase [Neolecta irregularis DAH-3]